MKIIASIPLYYYAKQITKDLKEAGLLFRRNGSFLVVDLPYMYGFFKIPEILMEKEIKRKTFFFIQEYEKGGIDRNKNKFSHIVCGAATGNRLPCRRVYVGNKHARFHVRNSLTTILAVEEEILVERHFLKIFDEHAWVESECLWTGSFLPPRLATFYSAVDAARKKMRERKSEICFGVVK